MIITIDGPAASGKSTVARKLAQKLNIYYLYTGLLYRAVAYVLVHEYKYTEKMLETCPDLDVVQTIIKQLEYVYDGNKASVTFKNKDITPYLKDGNMDAVTSKLSPHKKLRSLISHMQRLIAQKHDVIVEGRDSGSVVFPNADYKFFLTASLQVRAKRWQMMQKERGNEYSLQQAESMLAERDERDKNRIVAPLIKPEGCSVIDNSQMDIEQTVDAFITCMN